jgi:hypothetical protein
MPRSSNSPTLNVLYSADHEVFFGRNHLPEEEVVIGPTSDLLSVCDALGVPLTLFTDVASIWRYRDFSREHFAGAMETQLRAAIAAGHDVQAHLHPHWLFAQPEGTQWTFPLSTFAAGRLGDEPSGELEGLLRRIMEYLESLLQPVDPDYRCVAFRAGSYGLQPGEKSVLTALERAGFLCDSSVVPHLRVRNAVDDVDFTRVPRLANYRLSGSTGLDAPAAQGVYEIPIASRRYSLPAVPLLAWRRMRRRHLARMGHTTANRGESVQAALARRGRMRGAAAKLARLVTQRCEFLELTADPQSMIAITKAYLRSVNRSDSEVYFSLISHPKAVAQPQLDALEVYHAWLVSEFGARLRTITFREAASRFGRDPLASAP